MDKTRLKTFLVINCAVIVVGATFGLTMPLLTVVMKNWGTSDTVIGANAAMPALAAVIFSYYFHTILNRLGFIRFFYLSVLVTVASLALFPAFPSVPAWFVIRFLFGASQIALFALSEMWISQLPGEESRGRLIGIYTIVFSLGFIIGAIMVSITGVEGWKPFICGMIMISLASIPFYMVQSLAPRIDTNTGINFWMFLENTPHIAGAMLLTGILYVATIALTPAYALDQGLATRTATNSVAWLGAGALFIPYLVGHLADRVSRMRILRYMTAVTALLLWAFPWTFSDPVLRTISLLLIGGLANSFYTISLTLTGQHYNGVMLAGAIASMTVFYSLGELIGPLLCGIAMDIYPHGYSVALAAITSAYLLVLYATRTNTHTDNV